MMRAVLAWFLVSLTWKIRPVYALLTDMCSTRFARGTNPFRTFVDGFLFILIGFLMMLLPLVGLLLLPFSSIYFLLAQRHEYTTLKDLISSGRMNWWTGTIADKPKPAPKPEQPEEAEDAQ